MLKKALVIVAFFFMSSVMAADGTTNPYKQMQVAADQLFKTFDAKQADIKRNPDLLKDLVRQDLLPYVQTKYAGALILGNYYRDATEAQRDAYFAAFEDYLVQAFAQALSLYDGQSYQVEAEKSVDGKSIVSIRILLISADKNQQPIRLDFQWRKNTRSGEWKAYDMIAEGVSMITTKQNEWATTLRQNGIDALTKQLQQLASQPVKPEQTK
ncbi:phospholipid-binding protein MlaC [Zophobihabitans entericus]|uniref:Phospholipid-binding protein MlaC n=1 Tax=Zophobihabitans entericus TaxID=1635327 RepID=A0A6G9IDE8_9GAMM|nr:phospholipid-binding protein MlaC [Zophobihabitans entericus]QIQ22256.1 phospholipid-binding protein MlaC [Zophobihabitans entericus]